MGKFLHDPGGVVLTSDFITLLQGCPMEGAMEGQEYAGFHSNQSLHQLILLMNTSPIREEGTN